MKIRIQVILVSPDRATRTILPNSFEGRTLDLRDGDSLVIEIEGTMKDGEIMLEQDDQVILPEIRNEFGLF